MSGDPGIAIMDVGDETVFALLPPCADTRFDHRSCDYWEDATRGSKAARPDWWEAGPPTRPEPAPRPSPPDDPFAPASAHDAYDPFSAEALAAALDPLAGDDLFATPAFNPFAPRPPRPDAVAGPSVGPRKLRLLGRGRDIFGSYAKVLLVDGDPAAYVQFGPLSAYPRAQHVRDLYAALPRSPLPAVITCIATTPSARGRGLAARLVEEVCADLADRGFSAVEAYPDLTLAADEASAATPTFWRVCGFSVAVDDERYPVLRRELD